MRLFCGPASEIFVPRRACAICDHECFRGNVAPPFILPQPAASYQFWSVHPGAGWPSVRRHPVRLSLPSGRRRRPAQPPRSARAAILALRPYPAVEHRRSALLRHQRNDSWTPLRPLLAAGRAPGLRKALFSAPGNASGAALHRRHAPAVRNEGSQSSRNRRGDASAPRRQPDIPARPDLSGTQQHQSHCLVARSGGSVLPSRARTGPRLRHSQGVAAASVDRRGDNRGRRSIGPGRTWTCPGAISPHGWLISACWAISNIS